MNQTWQAQSVLTKTYRSVEKLRFLKTRYNIWCRLISLWCSLQKQNRTEQNKIKQNKTKQSKTKQTKQKQNKKQKQNSSTSNKLIGAMTVGVCVIWPHNLFQIIGKSLTKKKKKLVEDQSFFHSITNDFYECPEIKMIAWLNPSTRQNNFM